VILFQCIKEAFSFGIRLKLIAVLAHMNSIYCLVKLIRSTISFPKIPVCPVFRGRKVLVNLSQFLIKCITKLPQGIVYVDDCGFVHHNILTKPVNKKILYSFSKFDELIMFFNKLYVIAFGNRDE